MPVSKMSLATLKVIKMSDLVEISGVQIVEAASHWKPYLYNKLQNHSAVEEVFSSVLEELWTQRSRFDPQLGTLRSFAGGVTRNLLREYCSANAVRGELPLDAMPNRPALEPDHSFEERLILRVIASSVSPAMWAVMTARAYVTGTNKQRAAALGISEAQFRGRSFRLSEISETATAGVRLALAGEPAEDATLHLCLPELGGIRDAAAYLGTADAVKRLAGSAGVSRATAIRRLSRSKELLDVVRLAFTVVSDA